MPGCFFFRLPHQEHCTHLGTGLTIFFFFTWSQSESNRTTAILQGSLATLVHVTPRTGSNEYLPVCYQANGVVNSACLYERPYARRVGFEPTLSGLEPEVLPLNDLPMYFQLYQAERLSCNQFPVFAGEPPRVSFAGYPERSSGCLNACHGSEVPRWMAAYVIVMHPIIQHSGESCQLTCLTQTMNAITTTTMMPTIVS